jgi:hypothetical protein
MFAIIVGAAILFIALYATSKFADQEKDIQNSEFAKQLGVVLGPVETSMEDQASVPVTFPLETRVYNKCGTNGVFGQQEIGISTRAGIGKEWQSEGAYEKFYNRYIFSENYTEMKSMKVVTKRFDFPYKIGDVTVFIPDNKEYCIVDSPTEFEDELTSLNLKNINFTDSLSSCKKGSVTVCFVVGGCNVSVSAASKSVTKKGKTVYYEEGLIYGAIFSDPIIYECQVKRMMKRASELSKLYQDKIKISSTRGCPAESLGNLEGYANATASLNNSYDLKMLREDSQILEDINERLLCKVF